MCLGISGILRKIQVTHNCINFGIRRNIFGFDNANTFLRRLDKCSMIPILKRNGASIGNNCDIEAPLIFHNCQDFSNLRIGDNCHIGKNCFFDLKDEVLINDNAVISMQSTFITHIDMGNSELSHLYPDVHAPIIIKKNVYIGATSTILKGVTIAEDSFVAAGSVVNKDVLPLTMVGGVPAKFLKKIELK